MHYVSTNNALLKFSLSEAILQGLASDGGLFVPQSMPMIEPETFLLNRVYPDFAAQLLKIFFAEDVLLASLPKICKEAFSFSLPLKKLSPNRFVLELFHGPTASFKDFGAQFLAQCLMELGGRPKIILAATSGDTGSAVAAAFHNKKNTKAIIFYPENKISSMQEQQMTAWGNNVIAFAVKGNFDDCQQLVKSAFSEPGWQALGDLNSANSINIGRLLPQLTYYAYTSLKFYKEYGRKPGFIIPSGNLGNACAAYWAKALGFPIRAIVMTTNANRVVSNYIHTGVFEPKASIATLASAMDVGSPSNLTRFMHLFGSFQSLKKEMEVYAITDAIIKKSIASVKKKYNYIACPHTATAFAVEEKLDDKPWIIVSTAHPAKFKETIEPILGQTLPLNASLAPYALLKKQRIRVPNNLQEILNYLLRLQFIQ